MSDITTPIPPRTNNPLNTFLVALLVGAAFIIGALYSQVQTLKGSSPLAAAAGTNTAPAAGNPNPNTGAAEPAGGPRLAEIAAKIGIDQTKMQSCIDGGSQYDAVTAQLNSGTKAGINGTPGTLLISSKGAYLVSGALPFSDMKNLVDGMIKTGTPVISDQLKSYVTQVTTYDAPSAQDRIRGNANAKVTLIEYSDLQCPFCQRFHPTVTQLMQAYPNDIKWIYRHFPLNSIHPKAQKAAEAAECAFSLGGQDKYWNFIDEVFKQPSFEI